MKRKQSQQGLTTANNNKKLRPENVEKATPQNQKKDDQIKREKIPEESSSDSSSSSSSSSEDEKSEGKPEGKAEVKSEEKLEGKSHKVPGISSSDSSDSDETSDSSDSDENSKKGQEKISTEKIANSENMQQQISSIMLEPPKPVWPPVDTWSMDIIRKWSFRTEKQIKREPLPCDSIPVSSVVERLLSIKAELPIHTYYTLFTQLITKAGFCIASKMRSSSPNWPLVFLLFEKALDCGPTQITPNQKKQLIKCERYARTQHDNPLKLTRIELKKLKKKKKTRNKKTKEGECDIEQEKN